MSDINYQIKSKVRSADGQGVRLTVRLLGSSCAPLTTNEFEYILNALRHSVLATETGNDCFTYTFPFALGAGGGFTYTFPFVLDGDSGLVRLG